MSSSPAESKWRLRPRVAIAGLAIALLGVSPVALQATNVIDAEKAEATHQTVELKAECNPTTGLYNLTTTVKGDPGYPNETATIVSQSRATTPTLVGLTVKGTGTQVAYEKGVSITKKTEIVQTVAVQWTNHKKGDLITQSGKVTVDGTCKIKPGPPTQSVDCVNIAGTYNEALNTSHHINSTIATTVNGKDVELGQVNAYVDQNVAGGASYNGQNNLGLRTKILGVEQDPIPLTLDQIKSGVITFEYGPKLTEALAKLGYYSWKVTFVQTNATDTWPNFECDKTTKDAKAEVIVKTAATCLEGSTIEDKLVFATWESPLVRTPGQHTGTAIADDGHEFADGTKRQLVPYPIDAPDKSLCPHNASASVTVVQEHGCLTGTELNWSIANATWVSEPDLTVGSHTRTAKANDGIFFPDNGSTTEVQYLEVKYDVFAADPALCPKDASASIELDKKASCLTADAYKATLVNATLDAPLPTVPGTYVVSATATKGHNFADGSQSFKKEIVVAGANAGLCAALVTAGADVGLLILLAIGVIFAGLMLVVVPFRRRVFGLVGKLFGRTSAV